MGVAGSVGLGGVCLTADAAPACPLPHQEGESVGGASLRGSLLILGVEGRLNASTIDFADSSSVLTRLRLSDGKLIRTTLPMRKGHHAQQLKDGLILCSPQNGPTALIVDLEHRVVHQIDAPDGYFYSGHGLVLAHKNIFALPLCRSKRADDTAHGAIEIYDLNSFGLLRRVDQWGLNPHELVYCPERDEVVVADYGTLTSFTPPLLSQFGRPGVFTCDPDSFFVRRFYDQTDLNGAVTHLRVAQRGQVYFVLQQSVFVDIKSHANNYGAAVRAADQQVSRIFNLPARNYPLPYVQYETPEMSVPRPFVQVDLDSGHRVLHFVEPQFHIRPQSVEVNRLTGTVIASYTASDCLVMRGGGAPAVVMDGAALGINEIRGLADIPGTPWVAVSGSERNVAIVDVAAKAVVRRYRTRNFVAPHMSYDPSSD